MNDTDLHPDALNILGKFCKTIQVVNLSKVSIGINIFRALFTGNPLQVGYFYSRKAHIAIEKTIKELNPDHIYCQLIRTAEYVRNISTKKTLDYQDVFSKGIDRRKEFAPFWMKPFLNFEYKRLLNYEKKVFSLFDNKTIISKPDQEFIHHPDRGQIIIIPNGVDSLFFQQKETVKTTDLLFTGNMSYAPNILSAIFLIKEILPKIILKRPGIKLKIAGVNPDTKLMELASANIEIAGWVEDIRDSYNSAKIFIAPMQIGTGLQNKLLEAMSMNLPCITSKLANNSLGAKPGIEVLIGNSADEYADHVLNLLEDCNFAKKLASNGNQFVHSTYNWEVSTGILEKTILNT